MRNIQRELEEKDRYFSEVNERAARAEHEALWNVVIGGQQLPKTGKGLIFYDLPFLGQEGALVAMLVTLAPLAVLLVLIRIFPPWDDEHITDSPTPAMAH